MSAVLGTVLVVVGAVILVYETRGTVVGLIGAIVFGAGGVLLGSAP